MADFEWLAPGGHKRLVDNVTERLDEKPDGSAYAPDLTAGAALGITGNGPTDSAAWLQRVTTSDGPTTVKGIHGRALRWNQLVSDSDTSVTVPSGHKYVARIDGTTTLATSDGTAITVTGGTDNVFDLTAMFGAGNEPSTVAEFEALYPEPYYAYDAGSLLPVQMEGVESTSKNLVFKTLYSYSISASGVIVYTPTNDFSLACARVVAGETYTARYRNPGGTGDVVIAYFAEEPAGDSTSYDGSRLVAATTTGTYTFTAPISGYVCVRTPATYSTPQIEVGSDATEYEPYWQQQRSIPAGTLRSAGSVYDELTETERITRIGEVDLGTLTWNRLSNGIFQGQSLPDGANGVFNVLQCACAKYDALPTVDGSATMAQRPDKSIALQRDYPYVFVKDSAYTDAVTFKTAMDGVTFYYWLATPTTTPIDPPLNMTYRTEQGGTERVMVPTGELSAPPTLVTAQGYTAESLRDAALSAIAPVENGLASTNYGVGSYLVHGGQLCRVTTAIATGEAITIGTNVTATTVMAEVIALIAQ